RGSRSRFMNWRLASRSSLTHDAFACYKITVAIGPIARSKVVRLSMWPIQKRLAGRPRAASCRDVAVSHISAPQFGGAVSVNETTRLRIVEMEYGLHRIS